MSAPRKDYAIVEWEFLRFDKDYRALPFPERMAYLHLWSVCVHLRRDTFEKDEILGEYLSDLCGIPSSLMASMVEGCVARKLLSRGPRGSITIDGVRSKHKTLRGWNAPRLKKHSHAIAALDQERDQEREQESTGAASPPVFSFAGDLMQDNPENDPWDVTAKFHKRMAEAFPHLDLMAQYKQMVAWLEGNPTNRKTPRGMPRFVRSWLGRTQDRGQRAPQEDHSKRLPRLG